MVTVRHKDKAYQLPLLLVQVFVWRLLERNPYGTLDIKVSGIHETRGGSDITRLLQDFP